MKRILTLGFVLWAAAAQAAVVWTATRPQDCTAALTPTSCCAAGSTAANNCLTRNTAGQAFSVLAQFKSDGGTYTVGGDAVSAAQLGRLGLNTFTWVDCMVTNAGHGVVALLDAPGKVITFQLWNGTTQLTATAVAATVVISCTIYGR